MTHRCPLCTLRVTPEGALLVSYSGQPHLGARLGSILERAKKSHHAGDGFFALAVPRPRDQRALMELLDRELSAVEKRMIRIGSGGLAQLFGAPDLPTYLEILRSRWFDVALRDDQFTVYYQPIVDLDAGVSPAFECLIRLEGDRLYSGGEIFSAAALRGDILKLDAYAREKAIRSASGQRRADTKLFINFFPSALFDPEPCLESTLGAIEGAGITPQEIVFELLEYDPYADSAHTKRICEYLRSRGFAYAIDDLGTGTNELNLIETLRPDYVKIDKSVFWHRRDPDRREMLRKAVALSAKVGARVIAEGIETPQQAMEARKFGISWMQGYCFGKPSPVMRGGADRDVLRDLVRLASAVTSSSTVRERARVPTSS